MVKTVQIRPEQAELIQELEVLEKQATQRKVDAVRMALIGLVDGKAVVQKIDPDGTVTVLMQKQEVEET